MKKPGLMSKRFYDLRGFIVIELTDDEKQQRRNLFQTEEAQPELPF